MNDEIHEKMLCVKDDNLFSMLLEIADNICNENNVESNRPEKIGTNSISELQNENGKTSVDE